jgi:AraC-like DNA-binding protein
MRSVSPRSEYLTRPPAPVLTPYIERYIGYRLIGFPAGVHKGLPSRYMTLIVSIGPAIDVIAQTDSAQTPDSYRCVVGGLQASTALIAHDGNQEGVAIQLAPLGCRALFGMPARALWNISGEFEDIVGGAATELWERVQLADGWDERFAVCDDVFSRLVSDDELEPALRRSWLLLVGSAGTAPVAGLAGTIGWTRQHFARRFADEFGLSPKLAARVVRFDRAHRMLANPLLSIAQVAHACGYYDQAHLTRECTEFAGIPPGRLFADDLPSVQDTDASGPDHWTHERQPNIRLADPHLS